jgi:16S rRNA (cytidine1402-2'-O)-methyltransferase
MNIGKLYLIPTPLGDGAMHVLPAYVLERVRTLRFFIAERAKTARHFLKEVQMPVPMQDLHIVELNDRTTPEELKTFLQPALEQGADIGLMSEAGCPAVADPGALVVRMAHRKGVQVVPFVGASSILLAVMASGMQGQSFAFVGYIPVAAADRRKELQNLEKRSQQLKQTQLFIETPYRNEAMFQDCLQSLQANTLLGIAADLTLPTEYICTKTVAEWRKNPPASLNKRPAIFLILAN